MDSSSSLSMTKLKKHIDALSDLNFDSSQNVSDLMGSLSIFSNQSTPTFSTPTASTYEDEDDHLLDFLDSSKIDISTVDNSLEQSDISVNIDFTPPKISRRRIGKKDKPKLNKSKENDVPDFLDSFNNKFNLKATNLNEVIDFIESMNLNEDENKKQISEDFIPKRTQYENPIISFNGNSDQQLRIAQLQIERDSLQSQIEDYQIQIKELQNQITNYKTSNTTILESNRSLQRDIANLQKSMNSFHEIVEQQLSDISILSQQRAKLIEVTKKQESIIETYDSLYKSDRQSFLSQQQIQQQQRIKIDTEKQLKINLSKQQQKMEADMKNDFYTIMCSIVHSADNFLTSSKNNQLQKGEILDQIHQIRDDSEKPPRERILLLSKTLISYASSCQEKNEKNEELIEKQTESIEKYKRKCRDILSMYEEELNFLQTLTHSNDLQAAIFSSKNNQTPMILNDECKSELIRQCAVLGRFIEETIGSLSSDSFYGSFEGSEFIESSSNIFQLLQKSSIEKKMSNIFSKIEDHENIDTRQIFDLLAAQIYMNEVLKNYANEIQVRLAQNCHELNFLRQENETLHRQKNNDHSSLQPNLQRKHNQAQNSVDDEKSKTLQKLVKSFQKRENKLKRFTSNFVEIDDESNIVDATISLITQMNEQLLHQQSLSSQIAPSLPSLEESRLKEELNQCQSELKELEKQLKQQENERNNDQQLKNQIDSLNEKLKESQNQSQSLQNEIQNLKKEVSEKDKQIEDIKNEEQLKQKQYDISLDEAKNKLDSSIHTIKSLTHEVKQYEIVLARAKKQRPKLIKEIERLNKINQHLSETISKQNNQIKNEFDSKYSKLKSELDKCQKEKDAFESKTQQLSAEIATLTIEKKSNDLKIQAFDKRIELEKQNLLTQMNAKSNSIQVEQQQKINLINAAIEEALNKLAQLITDDFSFHNQDSLTDRLKTVVSMVESEMKKMKNIQCLYVDLLDDVSQGRKLLKVGSSTKISDTINQLLSMQESQINSNSDFQKIIKQDKLEIERLKRTINKFESKSASLKHWENWAKRLFRVIHEIDTHQLNSDELRLSLEEALLASVSHRSTLFKIESLRAQKAALLKFDSRLLLKPVGFNKISLHSLIALSIFVRRAQIQARCLPLNIRNNDFRQTQNFQIQRSENLNNNFDENDVLDADNKIRRPIIKTKSSVRVHEKIYNIKNNK